MRTSLPDLEPVYAEAAARLPTSADYSQALEDKQPERARIVFKHSSLPVPPRGLTTARVCIIAGSKSYDNLTVDMLGFSAHRQTYRALGLFILSALFTPGPNRFELALTHPVSHGRRLIVDTMYRGLEYGMSGLRIEASGAEYIPAHRYSQPLCRYDLSLEPSTRPEPPHTDELPKLTLTDKEELYMRGLLGETPVRDTIVGFGSDRGAYFLAELLLDASQEWNTELEYELELPCGFGGVSPRSAEVRLWLPGDHHWVPSEPEPAS